jgi:hypothetical protein
MVRLVIDGNTKSIFRDVLPSDTIIEPSLWNTTLGIDLLGIINSKTDILIPTSHLPVI